MTNTSKLQLHYFFNDKTHSIDANLRNDCEREILRLFSEVTRTFKFDVTIEAEPTLEGGFKEIWKFIGKNDKQLMLIAVVLTIWLSRIPVENKELVDLQMENLKLDNEIKKAELREINEKIKTEDQVTDEIVQRVVKIIESNYKVIWYKSNFYRRINNYSKIKKVSALTLDSKNVPVGKEMSVQRDSFSRFILRSDELAPNIDENAEIDIISPVIKKGNFNWKGYYKDEIISFQMADAIFKESVDKKQVEFVSGIAIRCVLKQFQKIDESGLVKVYKNKVEVVLEIIQDYERKPTKQGKKYLKEQELLKKQTKLNL